MNVLVSCKNEKVPIKMKAIGWSQHFSHCKSKGIFFRRSRAANSAVHGRIWLNFELIRDFMVVLVTFKNEEDPVKNEGSRVFTTSYINFSDAQGQITPESVVVSGRNSDSSKAFMHVLVSCKNEDDSIKMKELQCPQHFSHYKFMGIFSRRPRGANSAVLNPIWPNFELV